MRLVLDTNVIVSALLKPGSVPDLLLRAIAAGRAVIVHDARIASEYVEVVARPKFRGRLTPSLPRIARLLETRGELLEHVPRWDGAMADEDDRMFVEVARAGRADVLATGNLRDYPSDLGFDVEPPASVLARLEGDRH